MGERLSKVIVIGGGFTGLYYAYKNKGALVLSDKTDIVQKTFKKSDDAYIFLRYHILTKKLLDELKISYKLTNFTISYYYNRAVHKRPTPEAVYNYHMKSYGIPPVNLFQGYDINSYKIFTVKYSEIISALVEKLQDRIVYERATGILIKDKIVTANSDAYYYDLLLTTIPLPITCQLINSPELIELSSHLNAVPIGIYYDANPPKESSSQFKTNQVLNMDPDSDVLRWVKPIDANQGEYITEKLMLKANDTPDLYLKYGKIIPTEHTAEILKILKLNSIIPIGRFATWTPHYDTEDAIKEIDYMLNG